MTSIMMIPMLESSSRSKDSLAARVQPKPYRMPHLQLQSDDLTTMTRPSINNNNDNDTLAQPAINIGGAEYGNDDGFTTPVMHHHEPIIHIRNPKHYFQSFQLLLLFLSYPTPMMANI